MIILGIETSCDETALALIETRGVFDIDPEKNSLEIRIIDSLIHSQIDLHAEYGGVFPTVAKREHIKYLPILLEKILQSIESNPPRTNPGREGHTSRSHLDVAPPIDLIAVTEGPGLEPALWTGITFAEKLRKKWNIPVIPINHMEGHIVGSLLISDTSREWQQPIHLQFPALAILISGGHTEIVLLNRRTKSTEYDRKKDFGDETLNSDMDASDLPWDYTILGQTRDDAVGEAFDKVARLIGLPYPGGIHLSQLADKARKKSIKSPLTLPRPMIHSKDLDFSFSGLKTAVLYAVEQEIKNGLFDEKYKMGIAREFEEAVTDVIEKKIRKAINDTSPKMLIVGGGVSANIFIGEKLNKMIQDYNIPLCLPSKHISGDNALMVALATSYNSISTAISKKPLRAHGTKRLS